MNKEYAIYRNNRRVSKITFPSYEQARQHIRKILRKMGPEAYFTEIQKRNPGWGGMWDQISRNPTNFTELGYAIRTLQ